MNLDELLANLEEPILVRPTRRMTQAELESYLDTAANILRGSADHSEFRGYVFALLFYKRINDCFEEEVRIQAGNLTNAGVADPLGKLFRGRCCQSELQTAVSAKGTGALRADP